MAKEAREGVDVLLGQNRVVNLLCSDNSGFIRSKGRWGVKGLAKYFGNLFSQNLTIKMC